MAAPPGRADCWQHDTRLRPTPSLGEDIAGSTEPATRHDPEALRALLSAFFDETRQQIEAYGGTIGRGLASAPELLMLGELSMGLSPPGLEAP
jgi:hypothetical protein